MSDLSVREAVEGDAETVRNVIHTAFEARPALEPPTTALAETTESIRAGLVRDGGLVCHVDGIAVGALLFADTGQSLALRRVSAVPGFQSRGVASAMVGVAEEVAAARGYDDVSLLARSELPDTVTFWRRRGYAEGSRDGTSVTLAKALPAQVRAPSAGDMRDVGRRLGRLMQRGDLVILTGDLGAGKTTLAQGIGAGLRVRGDVTSPTFVISRVHPSLVGGPALVHVDAYRLGDAAELDDLDIDEFVDESVTVVEWGEGVAEGLAGDRLRVHLTRRRGGAGDEDDVGGDLRLICVTPVGVRWVGAGVRTAVTGSGSMDA